MTIRDLFAPVTSLNDLTVVQDSFERILDDRREEILRQRMSAGQQVGMMAERGRGDKKTRVPVNGVIKEVKNGKAIIVISAPVKYSGTKCRAPYQLIHDAFDLSKKKGTTFASAEEEIDFKEELLEGGSDPSEDLAGS